MKMRYFLLVSLSAVAGCSNPASETPVDPLPGNYEVFASVAFEVKKFDYCLKASEVGSWPHSVARKLADPDGKCTKKSADRQGNLATGTLACSNNFQAKTPVEVRSYEARVEADKATIVQRTRWDHMPGMTEAEKADVDLLNSGTELPEINYRATRIGDC